MLQRHDKAIIAIDISLDGRIIFGSVDGLWIWDPSRDREEVRCVGFWMLSYPGHARVPANVAADPVRPRFVAARSISVEFFGYDGRPILLDTPRLRGFADLVVGTSRRRLAGYHLADKSGIGKGAILLGVCLTVVFGHFGSPRVMLSLFLILTFMLLPLQLVRLLRDRNSTLRPRNLAEANGPFNAIRFSPDGRHLVTAGAKDLVAAGAKYGIQVWRADTGSLERTITAESVSASLFSTLAFDSSGTWLALADGLHGELSVWHYESGHLHIKDKIEVSSMTSGVAFSSDAAFVAYGNDESLMLRQIGDPAASPTILPLPETCRAVHFTPDGRFMLTALASSIRVWDYRALAKKASRGHRNRWVRAVQFSADGQWLAIGALPGEALIRHIDGSIIARLPDEAGVVHSVSVSPNGARVGTGSDDGSVRIWDTAGRAVSMFVDALDRSFTVFAVIFASDGNSVIAGCSDGDIRIWDMDGTLRARFSGLVRDDTDSGVYAVAAPKCGDWFVSAGGHFTGRLWRPSAPEEQILGRGERQFAETQKDAGVSLWQAEMVAGFQDLDGQERERLIIRDLTISPDDTWMAAAYSDGRIGIWGCPQQPLKPRRTRSVPLAFRSSVLSGRDGRRIAYPAGETGEGGIYFKAHDQQVNAVEASPDGTMLASVGGDDMLKVWNVYSGGCIAAIRFDSFLTDCTWSPLGGRIACSSNSGVCLLNLENFTPKS